MGSLLKKDGWEKRGERGRNERVPQSLIGGRKGVFVDCSKETAEEVVRI